ncbi:hypothetical protein [Niallia sp. MER TA 168]|uniref:hypothetical protein n=1 Tax=Niallia sp. MER TA 168 TaxID=2939568 RepID=UPI00203FE31E|nr:hypothetical protein [Niallia sp. MER TA 168]MCM3364799.1 hypothetical protein [Niallia sp. MER TA 168]
MAIYHLSMQIISRSKGQSAVASASYRSGEKLYDERSQESKYYKRLSDRVAALVRRIFSIKSKLLQ